MYGYRVDKKHDKNWKIIRNIRREIKRKVMKNLRKNSDLNFLTF